jgi:2-methylcitrate dehydratase PrpD
MGSFPTKLFEHSRDLQPDDQRCAGVATAFLDTVAVIYAGWNEPVTRAARHVYADILPPLAPGTGAMEPEQAALVWGTAAHALDFDDVHTTSVTHPSAVLIPAILAMQPPANASPARAVSAYIAGLATNIALGEALGFGHYLKGWHATSTIGPVAVAAALAHLHDADERVFRSALSLAVSQAAGTQRNFGSMAKPLHAGFAAAAGVRAARLALAGLEAAEDAFGDKGFFTLYGEGVREGLMDDIMMVHDAASLSRKLYPCCYMAHRPIAAAIELGRSLGPDVLADPSVAVRVTTPYGCTKALRCSRPVSGLEAKFSGEYTVAEALLRGRVDLASFEDEAVRRADVQNLLRRVTMVEEALDGPPPVGIDHGVVRIEATRGGKTLAAAECAHYPGSPNRPAGDGEIHAKVLDCVRHFGPAAPGRIEAADIVAASRRFAGLAI